MKKLVIWAGAILSIIFGYFYVLPMFAGPSCNLDSLKISTKEINLRDAQLGQLVLQRRFDDQAGSFYNELKSASNTMIYRTDKNRPWMSVFTANFRSSQVAKSAARHLETKYAKADKGNFKVFLDDQTVTLYSNHKFASQCYVKVVNRHSEAIPATTQIATTKAVKPKAAGKLSKGRLKSKKVAKNQQLLKVKKVTKTGKAKSRANIKLAKRAPNSVLKVKPKIKAKSGTKKLKRLVGKR